MKTIIKTPQDAILKLISKNEHFVESSSNDSLISPDVRKNTFENGQQPYAVIVTCSDSRVPPEHIFSAGLGELFVVRTAGNVVDNFAVGSIEYGTLHLNAKVIVVMGHSNCGAVAAAVSGHAEGCIADIVHEIKPGIAGYSSIPDAEDKNIKHTAEKILESPYISERVKSGILEVVCAKYDIQSGEVTFF